MFLFHRGMEVSQSRSHTPDPLSPEQQNSQSPAGRPPGPSPTMQQRIKAIGVPTPLAMSSPVRRSVSNVLGGAGVLLELVLAQCIMIACYAPHFTYSTLRLEPET